MPTRFGPIVAAAAFIGLTTLVFGRGDEPERAEVDAEMVLEDADAIPDSLQDAAFERYVDVALLRGAVLTGDARLLTDCALQLAEGERVLLRSHKGLKAETVLALATRAAVNRRDKETLQRLARAAKGEQKAMVDAAVKLAGAPSRSLAAPKVSIDQLTSEMLETFETVKEAIATAARLGDRKALGGIQVEIRGSELATPLKEYLAALAKEALQEMPAADDPVAQALQQLAGSTRSVLNPFERSRVYSYEIKVNLPLPVPCRIVPSPNVASLNSLLLLGKAAMNRRLEPGQTVKESRSSRGEPMILYYDYLHKKVRTGYLKNNSKYVFRSYLGGAGRPELRLFRLLS